MTDEVRGHRSRILVLCGFFDEFSGYNEVVLVRALSRHADVTVFASNRIAPVFSDEMLEEMGRTRTYPTGVSTSGEFEVHRFPVRDFRNMIWGKGVVKALKGAQFDHVLQLSPGQLFAAAGTLLKSPKSIVFPDNSAMWDHLSPVRRRVRSVAFAVSKGLVYRWMIAHADHVFATTPDGVAIISDLSRARRVEILPLPADQSVFAPDEQARDAARASLGVGEDGIVILAPGKPARGKQMERLVPAMEGLFVERNIKLVFTGVTDAEGSDAIREAIAAAPTPDRVVALPFQSQSELSSLMNAADVAIWPRFPGITIQQAMATGAFVLLPDLPTLEHLLANSKCGSYFQITDDLGAVVRSSLANLDLSPTARRERAQANAWLSGDGIAQRLLDAARENTTHEASSR